MLFRSNLEILDIAREWCKERGGVKKACRDTYEDSMSLYDYIDYYKKKWRDQKDDLQSARKQVGERSSNFIDKIRHAAHKRKIAVTRSRDSLFAKEQEQLRSIAESKIRSTSSKNHLGAINESKKATEKENVSHNSRYSELSLKKHSHKNNRSSIGFGGIGVPKVEKRPTTTPISPQLGSRRKGRKSATYMQEKTDKTSGKGSTKGHVVKPSGRNRFSNASACKTLKNNDKSVGNKEKHGGTEKVYKTRLKSRKTDASIGSSAVFKARPIPASTAGRWHAGQIGVPKVSKRAVTVPVSPCLGPKRQSEKPIKQTNGTSCCSENSESKTIASSRSAELSVPSRNITSPLSPSSVKSPELFGLNILDATEEERNSIIERNDSNNLTPKNSSFKPFEPQSTTRANMRKQYDVRRDENRELRLIQEREQLQLRIKVIHRELLILCKGLT